MEYTKTFLVLLLDNKSEDFSRVAELLAMAVDLGIEILYAFSIEEGAELIKSRELHLILLNIDMHGSEGIDALAVIKESGATAPIIVLSKSIQVDEALKLIRRGALDCINRERIKEPRSLVRIIFFAIERGRILRELRASEAHQKARADALTLELDALKNLINNPAKTETESVTRLREVVDKYEKKITE